MNNPYRYYQLYEVHLKLKLSIGDIETLLGKLNLVPYEFTNETDDEIIIKAYERDCKTDDSDVRVAKIYMSDLDIDKGNMYLYDLGIGDVNGNIMIPPVELINGGKMVLTLD